MKAKTMQTQKFISVKAALRYAEANPQVTKTHILKGKLLVPKEHRCKRQDVIKSHGIKSQFSHENFDSQRVFVIGRAGFIS